jgi:hypothetical protein
MNFLQNIFVSMIFEVTQSYKCFKIMISSKFYRLVLVFSYELAWALLHTNFLILIAKNITMHIFESLFNQSKIVIFIFIYPSIIPLCPT